MKKLFLTLALALATAVMCIAQNVFYVSTNGSARADGSAPDKAMKDLQKALDNATDGAIIRIAEGNYLGKLDADHAGYA